jgi:hypothetical protein
MAGDTGLSILSINIKMNRLARRKEAKRTHSKMMRGFQADHKPIKISMYQTKTKSQAGVEYTHYSYD